MLGSGKGVSAFTKINLKLVAPDFPRNFWHVCRGRGAAFKQRAHPGVWGREPDEEI